MLDQEARERGTQPDEVCGDAQLRHEEANCTLHAVDAVRGSLWRGGDEDRGASKAMQAARVRPVSISVICNRHFCQIVEAF